MKSPTIAWRFCSEVFMIAAVVRQILEPPTDLALSFGIIAIVFAIRHQTAVIMEDGGK